MASLFTKWLLCIAYMLRISINPLIETPSVSCQNKPIYYLRLQPTAFTPRPPFRLVGGFYGMHIQIFHALLSQLGHRDKLQMLANHRSWPQQQSIQKPHIIKSRLHKNSLCVSNVTVEFTLPHTVHLGRNPSKLAIQVVGLYEPVHLLHICLLFPSFMPNLMLRIS
ncbi:hypothetical protein U1Q18_041285 [Sarracenia purpurea var. burkii]